MTAALDLLAGLVLEDGRRWGDAAEPWQWDDARAVLDDSGGPRMHYLTRPRGASKTSDLAGIAAVALLEQLPPSARAYAVAADRDQGRLLVDALAGFVARTDGLAGAIRVDTWRATTAAGASLEILASDVASAFGLLPHFIVCDELAQWPVASRALWAALISALPKVKASRLVTLTSAGDPAHWSHSVREHARASVMWRLHEVPGPCPWLAPADLEEQRGLLTDSQFAQLHMNLWTAPDDRLVSGENLGRAVVLDGPQEARPGVVYRIGADLGLRHDRTAIAVCHSERAPDRVPPTSRVVLDRLIVFAGTREREVQLGDVETAVLQAWGAYNRAEVTLDPWQGVGLAQRLRAKGVSVREQSFTPQVYGRMANVLFTLLRDGRLALYPDEGLLDELANVRLRETVPGMLRVDHDPGRHDDMAVALGFAAMALVERGDYGPARLLVPRDTYRRPPIARTSPSQRGTVKVGRFTVPASAYRPPEREGLH